MHKIISAGNGRVKIYETSNTDEGEERITQKNSKKDVVQDLFHPKSGDYVICKYDDKVWVAFISFYDEEFDDVKVKLYPSGYNKYCRYPEIEDSCHLDKKNILKILAVPSLKLGAHRIQYYFRQKK